MGRPFGRVTLVFPPSHLRTFVSQSLGTPHMVRVAAQVRAGSPVLSSSHLLPQEGEMHTGFSEAGSNRGSKTFFFSQCQGTDTRLTVS